MLEPEQQEEDTPKRMIHGLLVRYKDDGINESLHAALQGKKRVHYTCMDVISNFMAFGTSVGAIYLFRLTSVTHTTCKLALVIPCDQGAIEVIKFVPNGNSAGISGGRGNNGDLLVAIGTTRGSIVIIQLSVQPETSSATHQQSASISAQEIYRAEEFTKSEYDASVGIKLIEYDQDLFDPNQAFTKLYICDQKCRIFVLESSSIYPAFRLLYSNKPAHVLSVDESEIHQIFVHRSQLLLSTDEKTRVFREYSNELVTVGRRQRKTRGFFGACFFNSIYKPARLQFNQPPQVNRVSSASSQQTMYSSTASLQDRENLIVFVARPKFSLWQVNYKLDVMFTHMFESSIKSTPACKVLELHNEPLRNVSDSSKDDQDSPQELTLNTSDFNLNSLQQDQVHEAPKSDHFEKLVPIFSTTLGNLLITHTRHEIFVIDPIGARLIVWCSYEKPIQQIGCNENEIFVLLEVNKRHIQVERIILLAPTQFVLELHRLNRYESLMAFVQIFSEQFRRLMALPLSGLGAITTEGGLLRNIVWNTWRECEAARKADDDSYGHFKKLVDELVDESNQLKRSIENLTDSQLFFTASSENIERLCCEPYASMVSLDISLASLHTNQVVHFSQEALNRHKSLAKLSQSIMSLNQLKRRASTRTSLLSIDEQTLCKIDSARDIAEEERKVQIEKPPPRKSLFAPKTNKTKSQSVKSLTPKTAVNEVPERDSSMQNDGEPSGEEDYQDPSRCPQCKWPKPAVHLSPMHTSQQIQYNWLQENLLPSFEENIEEIESRAFKHGLWHLLLRCFAFRNKLEDYIRCCIMLDDAELLDLDRLVITRCSEEIIELVFEQLEQKLSESNVCFKCKHEMEHQNFNLIVWLTKLLRKNGIKQAISALLQHPKLLAGPQIPASFYLQAINHHRDTILGNN